MVSYNKILAKAEARVKIMYLTEDNRINSKEAKIPVVGFIDIPNVTEENICDLDYEIKNMIIKPNSPEEHSVYVEIEMGVSAFCYEEKQINLIQDLYSPCENLEFNKKKITTITNKQTRKEIKQIREKVEIEGMENKNIIDAAIGEYKALFDEVMNILINYKQNSVNKMYMEGTDKIFDYKEFEDVGNVKNFLSVINTGEKLHNLINEDDVEISIKIGKDENAEDNMAVVTAKCVIAGREVGHAMVIGPERMDYQKVLGVLGGVTKAIEKIKKE